jgi:hypothetical protein
MGIGRDYGFTVTTASAVYVGRKIVQIPFTLSIRHPIQIQSRDILPVSALQPTNQPSQPSRTILSHSHCIYPICFSSLSPSVHRHTMYIPDIFKPKFQPPLLQCRKKSAVTSEKEIRSSKNDRVPKLRPNGYLQSPEYGTVQVQMCTK